MSRIEKINEQIKIFENKAEFAKNSGNSARAHDYQAKINKLLEEKESEEKWGAIRNERENLRAIIEKLDEKESLMIEKIHVIKEEKENLNNLLNDFRELFKNICTEKEEKIKSLDEAIEQVDKALKQLRV